MKPIEVRKLFLSFFEKRGHKIMPSSSLIPYDDPSVLLTTAGMQQFKKYFTGEKDALKDFGTQKVCSVQKCFRTTDIEEIGDERHLTFFEMLGNFSFGPVIKDDPEDFGTGGYFKKAAIFWAKEFLVNELGLNIEYVTIFKGDKTVPFDEESKSIWLSLGFDENKIKAFGKEDNFWGPTGDEGPCGPTTEIYIDGIEIWNLVFNEYYQEKTGKLRKLENPGVDTGMGLERLLKVLEKVPTVFETSLFIPLKEILLEEKNIEDLRKLRIILDHLRGIVFLIADGLYPSNLERGYVLRRIIRRLVLHFKLLGLKLILMEKLVKRVIENYKDFYPELDQYDRILKVFSEEANVFEKTLDRGMNKFEKIIKESDSPEVLGEKLFFLYATYGLPLEISQELLKERGLPELPDKTKEVFQKKFVEHQKISKKEK